MPTAAPARHLIDSAVAALGITGPAKHLTGRKGADVWHAGPWAIKTAVPGARGHLSHETAVYDLLYRQGRHPGASWDSREDGRWLAVPWLDGPSIWHLFAPARDGSATAGQRVQMRQAARAMFTALHQLHADGWIHGDVQPENAVLLPNGRAEFIDFDLSFHSLMPLGFPYRAGLVHVIAPELARQLLATSEDEPAECTPAAEVFAAGAGLYWAWTGHWPTDYRGPALARPRAGMPDHQGNRN